jgi:predicted CXXCH cytochrome family protein
MHLRYHAWSLLALLALAWTGCSREGDASGQSARSAPATPASATSPDAFTELLPQVGGNAGYTGSASCRECHADQHASWQRTFHRTMTQRAEPGAVQAKFDGVVLTNKDTRFRLRQKGPEYWVHMEKIAPGPPAGPDNPGVDVRLSLVTGSHHMQVFWVPNGAGNTQLGFPFTWLIPEQRWVPRTTTFLRPPDTVHQAETWNIVCSRCHTTAPEPHMDRANRRFETRVAELGISCEACHGPGERHLAFERAAVREKRSTKSAADHAIIHPEKLEPQRAAQICGFCHSMKWYERNEGWAQNGFKYRPGDDLEATTPVIRPRQLDRQPWLDKVLAANPNLLHDFFWSDGMIRVSGREYNGLIESPCYRGGQFSCLSCHSLHQSDPDDQLARNRTDNRACLQCHEPFREPARLTAHTHHAEGSSGSECYNCHMPHTTSGVLSAIRSHEISSPSVAIELATGRPNACNLCHLDRPLGWTAQHLEAWYSQPTPKLEPDQTQVADSVRLALAGDAGQRMLMAWHLGWKPARDASGSAWEAPVLAQLLEDDYAAVRCLAERSLRQTGGVVPPGFDYTVPPEPGSARGAVWADWWRGNPVRTTGTKPAPATLTDAATPAELSARFGRLLEQRDTRPLRLRE